LDEARSLAPLVQPDSRNLMLGHIVLFGSEFQQLREEASRRGPIAFIDCVRHRPASIVTQVPGENPLHAAMVHDLYSVQALVNRAEPTHFSAQYHRTRAGEVDLACAQLVFPGGTLASFAASYLTPAGMPPRGFDRMEVFGAGWAARISQSAADRLGRQPGRCRWRSYGSNQPEGSGRNVAFLTRRAA
jgi:predicted dehydrogenase